MEWTHVNTYGRYDFRSGAYLKISRELVTGKRGREVDVFGLATFVAATVIFQREHSVSYIDIYFT